MPRSYLIKTLVVFGVLGYFSTIDFAGARALDQQQALADATENIHNDMDLILQQQQPSQESNMDMDIDDDEEDDLQNQQNPSMASTSANFIYNQPIAQQAQKSYNAIPSPDLKTSASHHHHGHGAKGWLDMGAWTGKKGAFGWYDKHPVGKGK